MDGYLKKKITSNEEYQKVREIVKTVSRYNVFDFLQRVSALRFSSENQNKYVFLDVLTESCMSLPMEGSEAAPKMSAGKFRKTVSSLELLLVRFAMDPPEAVFVSKVLYYDNFLLFGGALQDSVFKVQMIIDSISANQELFPEQFVNKFQTLTALILQLSTEVIQKEALRQSQPSHINGDHITIPDRKTMARRACYTTIGRKLFMKWLGGDKELYEQIIVRPGSGVLNECLDSTTQSYFAAPFLEAGGHIIMLDYTILASFLVHKTIMLAKQYMCWMDLVDIFNTESWSHTIGSLSVWNHYPIQKKEEPFQLRDEKYYKEEVLLIGEKKYLLVLGVLDTLKRYGESSMFTQYSLSISDGYVLERADYFRKKLGCEQADLYIILFHNSTSRIPKLHFAAADKYKSLVLSAYELHCIAVNEKTIRNFLPKYMDRKKDREGSFHAYKTIDPLNLIEFYVGNGYTFESYDDVNMEETNLLIGFDHKIDYLYRAEEKQTNHLIQYPITDHIVEVTPTGEPYLFQMQLMKETLSFYYPGVHLPIFIEPVVSDPSVTFVGIEIARMIAYWLNECKWLLMLLCSVDEYLSIKVNYQETLHEIRPSKNEIIPPSIALSGNQLDIHLDGGNVFDLIASMDNQKEQELMRDIFLCMASEEEEEYEEIDRSLQEIFSPATKRFLQLLWFRDEIVALCSIKHYQPVNRELEEKVLVEDMIRKFVMDGTLKYGVIPAEDATSVSGRIVTYFTDMLCDMIAELSPDSLLECIYYEMEHTLLWLLVSESVYISEIHCFPDQQEQIERNYNDMAAESNAIKVLLEMITAVPPKGTRLIDHMYYERLVAISTLIIQWGYEGDLYLSKLKTTGVEVKKNNSIDFVKSENYHRYFVMRDARNQHLFRKEVQSGTSISIDEKYAEPFDMAIAAEYGCTFDQMRQVLFRIIVFGEGGEGIVKTANYDKLMDFVKVQLPELTLNQIDEIIGNFMLKSRESYLNPPEPFCSLDVYPWRFTRALSFTRRPLLLRDTEVIWGNKSLFQSFLYFVTLIETGRLQGQLKSKELKGFLGKITKDRGEEFNNLVYDRISAYPELIVRKNLKKINNERIRDKNNKELGDIDILYISKADRKIVMAEVKDFGLARTPYEIGREYKKMFVDHGNTRCFATKQRKRKEWIENHITDVLGHFNLSKGEWSVSSIFIVNWYVTSNRIFNEKERILTIDELELETLLSV